ncbi:Membrane-associated phosphatidylinositol transfer protein 2 [Armadillidium nasatum]|uniref:Membrane-associated phosphatidylinositol transfer protein 2 n=1 Tax=Armadillidium nasatum TaxID=96803 RepID=A0A5N5TPK7_9CRUS|nr:Membrane-associated phosphatidylinositol transfer protein 2 [Armadillidium nasatum]
MYRKSHSSCENQPPASTMTNAPLQETPQPVLRSISDSDYQYSKHLTAPFARRRSSSSSDVGGMKRLDFEINDLFLFGCPLGIVLVYRKMTSTEDKTYIIMINQ